MFSTPDITSDCLERFYLDICFIVEGMAKKLFPSKIYIITGTIEYQVEIRDPRFIGIKSKTSFVTEMRVIWRVCDSSSCLSCGIVAKLSSLRSRSPVSIHLAP